MIENASRIYHMIKDRILTVKNYIEMGTTERPQINITHNIAFQKPADRNEAVTFPPILHLTV